MPSLQEQIETAYQQVDEVREIYRLNYLDANGTCRSVEALQAIAKDKADKPITYEELQTPWRNQHVRGWCKNLADRYAIVLLSEQKFCWIRMVLAKEIFQVLVDNPEYRIVSISSLIGMALAPSGSVTAPICSELAAEIAAMEFLFPYAEREIILAKEGIPDFQHIAEQYKVPRVMVEKHLSKPVMEHFRRQ